LRYTGKRRRNHDALRRLTPETDSSRHPGLERIWKGLTNREIGKIIGPSEQVIKNQGRSTFDKLGVRSRLELAM